MPISVSCANVSYIYKDHCLVVVSLKMFFFFFYWRLFFKHPIALFLCFVCISFICYTLEYAPHNFANSDVSWGQRDCCLWLIWHVEAWLSPCVFAGGRSHRDWSETANTGHVSFLQQAQEQVLLSLGSRHYLKEKNESPPQHQPGPWGFTVIFKFQEDQYNCLSYTKIYLLFPWAFILHCSAWVMTTWPPFCPNRSLLMVKSQWKSLQMAYMSILPRNTQ